MVPFRLQAIHLRVIAYRLRDARVISIRLRDARAIPNWLLVFFLFFFLN